jgi:hypothetical protein
VEEAELVRVAEAGLVDPVAWAMLEVEAERAEAVVPQAEAV